MILFLFNNLHRILILSNRHSLASIYRQVVVRRVRLRFWHLRVGLRILVR